MAKKKSSIGFDPLAWMKNDSRQSSVIGRQSMTKTDDRRPTTDDSRSVIMLGDSFTITDVATRHAEWKKLLVGGGRIDIDGGVLKTVDAAALQLLAALAREAQARGLSLRWRAASDALRQGAERLGLKTALRLS
jgi:anti-anti-sigma regulatory factor